MNQIGYNTKNYLYFQFRCLYLFNFQFSKLYFQFYTNLNENLNRLSQNKG